MKAPGLSKAMRAALEFVKECEFFPENVSTRVFNEAQRMEFVESSEPCVYVLTPRGHSALSAPAMTRAGHDLLQRLVAVTTDGSMPTLLLPRQRRAALTLLSAGLIDMDCDWYARPNRASSKALNDMRAAEGSDLWKP